MEFKTNALVLRATDYGENDRIVTLLTEDRGKIAAAAKGVRKAGAKLRFSAQPFCFAEYVLAEKSGRNTVISASLHDGFYSLREDLAACYGAAGVCEICDTLVYENMESGPLLVAAVKALGELSEGGGAAAVVRFAVRALRLAGYPVTAGGCPVCGRIPDGRMRFSMESGAFGCADHIEGVPASLVTYRSVRAADGEGESEADGDVRALRLLGAYLSHRTETDFPALKAYAALFA